MSFKPIMICLAFGLALASAVFADAPKTLHEHFDEMTALQKNARVSDKTATLDNDYKGYLVKINAVELTRTEKNFYIYSVDLTGDTGRTIGIILNRTEALTGMVHEVQSIEHAQSRNALALSKEGGRFAIGGRSTSHMYVIAKPAGFADCKGSTGKKCNTVAFDVIDVCDGYDYKHCKRIQEPASKSWFSQLISK